MDTVREESVALTYIHYHVKEIASGKLLSTTGNSVRCSATTSRGRRKVQGGEDMYIYMLLFVSIAVVV